MDKHPALNTEDFSQERLDDSLFRFADALSGGRWDQREVQKVGVSRTAGDYIGEELPVGETLEVFPITMETKLAFSADKTGGIRGDVDFGTPRYIVKSTVEQDIEFDELPLMIQEEVLEEGYEKGHPLRKVLKEFGATSDRDDIYETLHDVSFERRAKSKFVVADGGAIVRHSMSHRYAYQDVVFLSAEYASDTGNMDWRRIDRPKGFAVELRPAVLEYISEDEKTRENEILRQAAGLDTELEHYFFEKSLTEMLRTDGQSAEASTRQIIGILALLSTGMKHYRP